MPTYEYVCRACGHEFEKFQSITADPVKVCPVCKEEQVQKRISGGNGLIFKGSGFYITDYKNSKTSTGSKAEKKPEKKAKEEKKPTAKTE